MERYSDFVPSEIADGERPAETLRRVLQETADRARQIYKAQDILDVLRGEVVLTPSFVSFIDELVALGGELAFFAETNGTRIALPPKSPEHTSCQFIGFDRFIHPDGSLTALLSSERGRFPVIINAQALEGWTIV